MHNPIVGFVAHTNRGASSEFYCGIWGLLEVWSAQTGKPREDIYDAGRSFSSADRETFCSKKNQTKPHHTPNTIVLQGFCWKRCGWRWACPPYYPAVDHQGCI
jgi:hypothetical protein